MFVTLISVDNKSLYNLEEHIISQNINIWPTDKLPICIKI